MAFPLVMHFQSSATALLYAHLSSKLLARRLNRASAISYTTLQALLRGVARHDRMISETQTFGQNNHAHLLARLHPCPM